MLECLNDIQEIKMLFEVRFSSKADDDEMKNERPGTEHSN